MTSASSVIDVAVIDPQGLAGEALLTLLHEREFPLGEVYPLASEESAGQTLLFGGKRKTTKDIAQFDFSGVRIAFFCGTAELTRAYAEQAAESGCIVIDSSGAFSDDPHVPVVVPEVNAHALYEMAGRNIVTSPFSAVTALALALAPLQRSVGINHVNLTALLPVSAAGKAGVDELSRQTIALLNLKPIETECFSQQIAFNTLPLVGEVMDNGYTGVEGRIASECRRVLEDEGVLINVSAVQVPVFFGDSLVLELETRDKLDVLATRELLTQVDGIELFAAEPPTPIANAVKSDTVLVARIREDVSLEYGLAMWIVADNIRRGTALNMIQIAERLVKDHI